MSTFFDTSVLVATFYGDHVNHETSLAAFASARPGEAACAGHSLAEVFSVMTRLPVKPSIGPQQARLFIESLQERLRIVTLAEGDYFAVIESAAARGIVGGKIYDALILRCAELSGAEVILTWNLSHFRSIAPHLASRIQTPRAE